MYELFLKTHLIFALALAVVLWLHVDLTKTRTAICLGIASALWLVQYVTWLVRLIYRNPTPRSEDVHFTSFPARYSSSQVMDVTITLKRPWKVAPGQYIYLTHPSISLHQASFLQAHPYIIAWEEDTTITVLIQRDKGFTEALFTSPSLASSIIVDGPYGHSQPLDEYDKVLFIASGIGIAAHLLQIKHLLDAHNNKSARVRRVTLVWFLETIGKQ